MKIQYREMKPEDRTQIIKLFYEFCELYITLDQQGINIISQKLAEWCLEDMMKEIHKTTGKVIVAESDTTILGFIGFFIKHAEGDQLLYHRPHTFGVIYNLYIDETYRNHKIGTELLEKAEKYFKENGCEFSKLQVFGTNYKAQDFYKRHSYAPRNIDLIKKL